MIPSGSPLFVHSDTARGLIAAKRCGARIDPRALQVSLVEFLASQTDSGERGLMYPAFNYNYGRTRTFDVDNDVIQVGTLPEWLRTTGKMRRTAVPFFSFLSMVDLEVDTSGKINPFGSKSGFQWLVDHDANLVLFGANLNSLTFIHYVEEMTGGPAYRYIKDFPGRIITADGEQSCDFSMHVRPAGVHMDYDWSRLEIDLRSQGILQSTETAPTLKWLNARDLLEYWGNRISQDPLYLLDASSRDYFDEVTQGGVTRIEQRDFEKCMTC